MLTGFIVFGVNKNGQNDICLMLATDILAILRECSKYNFRILEIRSEDKDIYYYSLN